MDRFHLILQDFIYPENAAYPLGGPDSPRYVVIEIHYDNPLLHSGECSNHDCMFQPRVYYYSHWYICLLI